MGDGRCSPVMVQARDAGVGVGAACRVCVGDASGRDVEDHESDEIGDRDGDDNLHAMGATRHLVREESGVRVSKADGLYDGVGCRRRALC